MNASAPVRRGGGGGGDRRFKTRRNPRGTRVRPRPNPIQTIRRHKAILCSRRSLPRWRVGNPISWRRRRRCLLMPARFHPSLASSLADRLQESRIPLQVLATVSDRRECLGRVEEGGEGRDRGSYAVLCEAVSPRVSRLIWGGRQNHESPLGPMLLITCLLSGGGREGEGGGRPRPLPCPLLEKKDAHSRF